MSQKPFATKATVRKLQTVGDYLAFYTSALSRQRFRLSYFDAFAGSGEIPHGDELPLFEGMEELSTVIDGSARRSLKIVPPFDRYYFADNKRKHVTSLHRLKIEFANLSDRIDVLHGDANQLVQEFCGSSFKSTDRAVVFLDPFGNQVSWRTIEVIANTKGIDLWYLFPAGLGVVRQLSSDAAVQQDAEKSLNLIFGDREWYSALTEAEPQLSFLDEHSEARRKVATADSVTRYMIRKMKIIFHGRVLDEWLPLCARGGQWYSLIFAWSNPSRAATELASRVARDIMRRK